jgi:Ca2+-binding EF-hand superfamily protein
VKELNLKSAFRVLDHDNDGEISLQDFQYSVKKILQIRKSDDELLLYWKKIPIALGNM